ncbi:hypothetical protein EDB80DRAFT_573753, partial [Ilyonectria destructans]
ASAAALMCGGITEYTALKRANVQHGQWVVMSGAGGGLGHLAIQHAITLGVRVVALNLGPKEALCRHLGAESFLDFTKFQGDDDLASEVQKITGSGANIVLVCSSS